MRSTTMSSPAKTQVRTAIRDAIHALNCGPEFREHGQYCKGAMNSESLSVATDAVMLLLRPRRMMDSEKAK